MVSHGEHRNGGSGECGGGHSDGELLLVFFLIVFFFDDFFLEKVSDLNSGLPGPGGIQFIIDGNFLSDVFSCGCDGKERAENLAFVSIGFTAVIKGGRCFSSGNGGITGCLASVGVGNSAARQISIFPSKFYIIAEDCFFGSDGGNKEGNGVFHLFV
tara:strand:- start:94 stop:564 length:471 start_codon:yes stop_codon:yes gene_type:complete